MSSYREMCPECKPGTALLEETDGMGFARLVCLCGYVENVQRRVDPWKTEYFTYTSPDGRSRRRTMDRRTVRSREIAAMLGDDSSTTRKVGAAENKKFTPKSKKTPGRNAA